MSGDRILGLHRATWDNMTLEERLDIIDSNGDDFSVVSGIESHIENEYFVANNAAKQDGFEEGYQDGYEDGYGDGSRGFGNKYDNYRIQG